MNKILTSIIEALTAIFIALFTLTFVILSIPTTWIVILLLILICRQGG